MSEGNKCQNFSGSRWNISNHYNFDMVLAKGPWQSSVFYISADHLPAYWGQPGRYIYPSYCTWSM